MALTHSPLTISLMSMRKINTVLLCEDLQLSFAVHWGFDRNKGEWQTVCTSTVGFELQLWICLLLTHQEWVSVELQLMFQFYCRTEIGVSFLVQNQDSSLNFHRLSPDFMCRIKTWVSILRLKVYFWLMILSFISLNNKYYYLLFHSKFCIIIIFT